MHLKKIGILALTGSLLFLSGCSSNNENVNLVEEEKVQVVEENTVLENGRYRGIYGDRGDQQVSIQFHLEEGLLTNLSYRHLYHSGNDYRNMDEGDPLYPIVLQHQEILDYLEGKEWPAIFDLYETENIVSDIDGFTGATIRGSKIISALQDGLNRGLYTPSGEYSTDLPEYPDGRYRGVFEDRGYQQVSIQFHLKDQVIHDLSYRHLFHNDHDYRNMDENDPLYPIVLQHQQILDYLDGKPLNEIFALYHPESIIEDIDGFTGATVRANKVHSAIRDGLNRGLYRVEETSELKMLDYADGRYRGTYGDRGDMQVSIQFTLEEGLFTNLSYRHLYHSGNDYRNMDENDPLYPIVLQHQEILDYLEGKPLTAIFDLYQPDKVITDIDGFTGATIRGAKVISAIQDALNRGIY